MMQEEHTAIKFCLSTGSTHQSITLQYALINNKQLTTSCTSY